MQEILSKKLLGERIRLLRLENSYAQAYVADFLNLSRSNYSQIELGNQYPTFTTLSILSKHYNKSFEWFLNGREERVKTLAAINPTFITVVNELEQNLKSFSASLKLLEKELQGIKNNMIST